MSGQRIHDIKILSATASYLPEVGKIECIVKGAVLDIENNFLDLEGLKVFVGDKQAAEDATDMKGNFSTRLYFDFEPDVDALDMYLEHIPTEIQSSRKYIPIANLPKKKEPTSPPKVEAKQEVAPVESSPGSPITKGAAITAVKQNGLLLGDIEYAHLVDDKALVMEAVKQNGLALEFASERLKKDIEIFNIAVEQNEDAALFADEGVYKEYNQFKNMTKNNCSIYYKDSSYSREFDKFVKLGRTDSEFFLSGLSPNRMLYYMGTKLASNKSFILKNIKNGGLTSDTSFILNTISSSRENLIFDPDIFIHIMPYLKVMKQEYSYYLIAKDGQAGIFSINSHHLLLKNLIKNDHEIKNRLKKIEKMPGVRAERFKGL